MELLLLLPEVKQGRDRGLCVTGSARPHLCSTHSPPLPPAGWRRGSQAQPPGRAGAVTPREGVAHGDRARTGRPLGCVWAAAVDAGVCVCVCVSRAPATCSASARGAATGGVGGGAGTPGPAAAPKMGGWEDGLQAGLSSGTPPLTRLPVPPSPPFPAAVLEAGGGWLAGVCFPHGAPCWPSHRGLHVSPGQVDWLRGPFRKCLCDVSGMSLPADFLSWRNLRLLGV